MLTDNNFSFNIGGKLLDVSEPSVMSIINTTPDSFYSQSRKNSEGELLEAVHRALREGASVLDLGAYSTRPGADEVSTEEEVRRMHFALSTIKKAYGTLSTPISVDTFRSEVVKCALDTWGAVIVNDVSAGEGDPLMLQTIADNKLPYIAMHKKGTPKNMCSMNNYEGGVVDYIINYFADKLALYKSYGINDVMLDVGFGFAKDLSQNFELARRYDEFKVLGCPTLVGVSRKRMVWQTLDITIEESLNGTSILNYELLRGGANMLRVHDTKEAVQAIQLHKSIIAE